MQKFFLSNALLSLIFCFSVLAGNKAAFGQSASLFEHFSVNDGLTSDQIFDVTQTGDGNIWLATAKGISRFDGYKFQSFDQSDGLTDLEIIGIITDPIGKIWCWSSSGNIFYFENNSFVKFGPSSGFSHKIQNRIFNSLCVDRNGQIWISTVIPGEILKIQPDGFEEISPPQIKASFFIKQVDEKNFVYGSFKTEEENNLLEVFLKDESFSFTLSEKGNFSKSSFFPFRNDEYLFAKGQELIHFKNNKIIQRSFTEKNVQDILKDSEGKIWAGLYLGGVLCYPEGKLNSAGMISYLGNRSVSSILEDNSGNIWFTTMEDGVYYLPARSKLIYSSPKIFSQKSGNLSDEKPKAVSPFGRQAEIFPAPGFRVISTDTAIIDTIPPAIFISGVKILEKDTVVLPHYTLSFDQNFLKINFVGFAYSDPEALKYKYRMEGVDKTWIYTDNAFVQYTTLPPGKYHFMVSAMNKSGVWSDSPAWISFAIMPPYWQTWWFLFLMATAVAAIVTLFFFSRVSQIKKREKEKAEVTRQMANSELQALRAQMNPHFIFNTMSSIQYFITKNEREDALKYLSKFAKLMRKIMDNSRKSVIPLKDELEALGLYLELESLRFKNKFEYSISIDTAIDQNDEEIPPMLIQPYIENAILHGLMNKEGKGTIAISFSKQQGLMVCSVQDDGIGRERSREINSALKRKHSSSGMSITKSRLEILNSINQSNLSVNIIDLKDGNLPAGTRVEIFIPV